MFKNLSAQGVGTSGSQNELIESALSFGFRGLDMNLMEFVGQVKSRGSAHARRLLDSAKFQVGGFELPTRWQARRRDYRAETGATARMDRRRRRSGLSPAHLTWIEPANDEQPFHQKFETSRKRLAELAKALEPHGIRLGVAF